MCHLFVFMGCYFPVGTFEDEGQASFRNHNQFKGIIWSMYQWTWTWVWVNSGRWWWTERPGVLWSMGLQRAGRNWETELNWSIYISVLSLLQAVRYTTDGRPMDIRMVFILWHVHRLGEIWMAVDSVTIPRTEEPGGLQSMGSLRVGHNWANLLSLFTFMHWRRKWQPTPVFLPGESQGRGSLVGCCLWGRIESDTTEAS